MRLRLFALAALVCAVAACGAPSPTSARHAATSAVPARPTPSPSPSPSTPHEIALAWWNGSAHEALHNLRTAVQQFQRLAEQGKVDEDVCQTLKKAAQDAASIGGSGIDALDSAWFPMTQHFSFMGTECQTAASVDLDSAWESMTEELQLATKDLLAFSSQLDKSLGVSNVDTT